MRAKGRPLSGCAGKEDERKRVDACGRPRSPVAAWSCTGPAGPSHQEGWYARVYWLLNGVLCPKGHSGASGWHRLRGGAPSVPLISFENADPVLETCRPGARAQAAKNKQQPAKEKTNERSHNKTRAERAHLMECPFHLQVPWMTPSQAAGPSSGRAAGATCREQARVVSRRAVVPRLTSPLWPRHGCNNRCIRNKCGVKRRTVSS